MKEPSLFIEEACLRFPPSAKHTGLNTFGVGGFAALKGGSDSPHFRGRVRLYKVGVYEDRLRLVSR